MCHCKGNGGLSIRGLFGGMTSWIKYLLHSLIRKQLPRGLLQRFSFHLPPVLRLVMNMRRLRCFLSALHRTFTAWMCERGTRQSEETISSSKTQIVYKRPDFVRLSAAFYPNRTGVQSTWDMLKVELEVHSLKHVKLKTTNIWYHKYTSLDCLWQTEMEERIQPAESWEWLE